jgi:hypothetical protein
VAQFNGANIVTNAANITLSGTSSKITDQGGTINALANFAINSSTGSITLSGNQNLMTSGNLTNAGTLTVAKGSTLTLNSGGSYSQTGGITTVDGTLTSSLITSALNLNAGSLFGTGTLGFSVIDGGILTPGDSKTKTGMLAVSGTYHQNSTGVLNISVGGTTAGTKYDQLNVTGAATVNGTLNLSLIGGFVPTVGTTFEILNASSLAGTFSTINGAQINASEHFSVSCDTTDCDVTVVSGAASVASARVHGSGHSWATADFASGVVSSPRRSDVAERLTAFHREKLPMVRTRDLNQLRYQIAEPRNRPSAVVDSGLAVSRASARPPRLPGAPNHAIPNHKTLEFGVDLFSLLGTSPRNLMQGFVGSGPAPTVGYVFVNGLR